MKISLGMNNNALKIIKELVPAITAIFKLGFIPNDNEIVEFNENMYESFIIQMGLEGKTMYHIIPENPKYRQDDTNEINAMSDDEVGYLRQGIAFFAKYANENDLPADDAEMILKHAASKLPLNLSEGTIFEPQKKLLKGNIEGNIEKERWEYLFKCASGVNEIISFNFKDENGIEHDEVFMPNATEDFKESRLTYKEFKSYAINSLAAIFGEGQYDIVEDVSKISDEESYEVIHLKEKKENGAIRNGFKIKPFYTSYQAGSPLGDIVLEMVKTIEETDEWVTRFDFNSMNEFEKAKNKLILRPINYQRNKIMLEDYMYQLYGDVAIVVYMLVKNDSTGMATTKINKKTIEKWNLPETFVFDWAADNTVKLHKPYIIPMDEVISGTNINNYPAYRKFFTEPTFKLKKARMGAYLLGMDKNINSATLVFLPKIVKKLAETLDDDIYFVVPSMSYAVAHVKRSIPLERLKRITKDEKNNPYADPNEYLTDSLYYYSLLDDNLTII